MTNRSLLAGMSARLLLRQAGLGLVAYVCAAEERTGNRALSLTLFMCAIIWSSWDGLLGRAGRFGRETALAEGVLLYLGAALFAHVLQQVFGLAPIGW